MDTPFYCSVYTREHNNPLAGTMNPFQHALLVEYPNTFAQKPMGGAAIDPAIKAQILAQEKSFKSLGGVKLLLIRNVKTVTQPSEELKVWYLSQFGPNIRVVTLPQVELVGPSIEELVERLTQGPTHEGFYPQYLVCTNGKRDKCCARFGFPLYRELYQHFAERPDTVWESSHVGGHRFAANVITFPDGVMYGHIDLSDMTRLIEHTDHHQLMLDKYRGRALLTKSAQFAEHALRETHNLPAVQAISQVRVFSEGSTTEVTLDVSEPAQQYQVILSPITLTIADNCELGTTTQAAYWQVDKMRLLPSLQE